jgi:hypothetical protein
MLEVIDSFRRHIWFCRGEKDIALTSSRIVGANFDEPDLLGQAATKSVFRYCPKQIDHAVDVSAL